MRECFLFFYCSFLFHFDFYCFLVGWLVFIFVFCCCIKTINFKLSFQQKPSIEFKRYLWLLPKLKSSLYLVTDRKEESQFYFFKKLLVGQAYSAQDKVL